MDFPFHRQRVGLRAIILGAALIACLSSASFAEIRLHMAIDSVAAIEGDSLCIVNVYVDNPSDTIAAFSVIIQMDGNDYAQFRPAPVDTQGTLVSGWEFITTRMLTPQTLKIIGIADYYPGGPPAHNPGIPPQTGGILLKLQIRTFDHVVLPMDSMVVLLTNWRMLDMVNFSDPNGQLIGTVTTTEIDTSYFACIQWNDTICTSWVRTYDPLEADSTSVDTFYVTAYDTTLSRFDDGKIQVLFRSGDANGSHSVNVGDAVYLINYIFKAGPQPPMRFAGDCNCDANVNVGDAVRIINYVFKGSPQPRCLH